MFRENLRSSRGDKVNYTQTQAGRYLSSRNVFASLSFVRFTLLRLEKTSVCLQAFQHPSQCLICLSGYGAQTGCCFSRSKEKGKVKVNQNASKYPHNVMHTVHWSYSEEQHSPCSEQHFSNNRMPLGHNVYTIISKKANMLSPEQDSHHPVDTNT